MNAVDVDVSSRRRSCGRCDVICVRRGLINQLCQRISNRSESVQEGSCLRPAQAGSGVEVGWLRAGRGPVM